MHSDAEKYKCDVCGEHFKRIYLLAEHKCRVHRTRAHANTVVE
jgi:hypothetical protein